MRLRKELALERGLVRMLQARERIFPKPTPPGNDEDAKDWEFPPTVHFISNIGQ
jgi:hypothetical protein